MCENITEEHKQLTISTAIIAVTKALMDHFSISYEQAFKKLVATDFFDFLNNYDSGLCLEPDWYVAKACLLEIEEGRDSMIHFINTY